MAPEQRAKKITTKAIIRMDTIFTHVSKPWLVRGSSYSYSGMKERTRRWVEGFLDPQAAAVEALSAEKETTSLALPRLQ